MNYLRSSFRLVVLSAAVCSPLLFHVSTVFSADVLTIEKIDNSTTWKIKAKITGRKIKSVWIGETVDGAEPREVQAIGTPKDSPTEYEIEIPADLRSGTSSKELVAMFVIAEPNDKLLAPMTRKIVFNGGILTKKSLSGTRVIPPTQSQDVTQTTSDITSNSPVNDAAKQLTKWILDRALNGKVPGVAYFDHQPKKTTALFAKLFSDLAKSASASKQLSDQGQIDAKVIELRQAMRDGLDKIYETRGVKEDWQPFLIEIQNQVGDSHSDQQVNGATTQGKFDLNNLEHIAAVFAAIASAFNELSANHEKVEKYFVGGGSLVGSGSSFGGASGANSTPFGNGGFDECKCRRRRHSCWSLLLGM